MSERVVDPGASTVSAATHPTGAPAASAAPVPWVAGAGCDLNHQVSDLEAKTKGKHITAIAAGQIHSLALTADGKVIVAGSEVVYDDHPGLEAKTKGKHITAIAAGEHYSLALTADGEVIAAGAEVVDHDHSGLVAKTKGKHITAIAAGRDSSLALTAEGEVIGAGDSQWNEASGLVAKTKGQHITAIADSWAHSLALTADGRVIGAGDDKYRQVSDLVAKTKGKHITAIAAGEIHSLALTADGEVIAAGTYEHAGEITDLVAQTKGKHITAIAACALSHYSLALTADGQVIAAGEYRYGMIPKLKEKTKGKKVTAIAAGDDFALTLIKPQARMMAGQAAVASLPQAATLNELCASGIRCSATPASQHTTIAGDSLKKGENQSVQVSQGDSSITTTLSGGVATVHGTVTAATAQAGTNAPMVASLTAMSLDVTVTSTNDGAPSPTVHLQFNEITINGQPQPTTPAPNTTVPLNNDGKAILNHQQPNDTGIDVTAVALFDNRGNEVMRLGHINAHLPVATT